MKSAASENFGWPVSRLIRVGYGPFLLDDLGPWRRWKKSPPQALDNLLGLKPPPRKTGWAKPKPRPRPHQRRH